MSEYAENVLDRLGTRATVKGGRKLLYVESVECGFCHGGRHDVCGGTCGVCKGHGHVPVKPPVIRCLKCHGTGRTNGTLTCLACRGVGVVEVREDATTCPNCHGTGREGKSGIFACTRCRGQGIC